MDGRPQAAASRSRRCRSGAIESHPIFGFACLGLKRLDGFVADAANRWADWLMTAEDRQARLLRESAGLLAAVRLASDPPALTRKMPNL
jgi:hypothetical protein